jgi:hypothetical protein
MEFIWSYGVLLLLVLLVRVLFKTVSIWGFDFNFISNWILGFYFEFDFGHFGISGLLG